MTLFSVIIAVYNRPQELEELLHSLEKCQDDDIEVIVVEDGSTMTSVEVVNAFKDKLTLRYIEKENTGQGFSRNEAAKIASGKYLLFFDSDCLVPAEYFDVVREYIKSKEVLFWGGPDAAHISFTPLQKAISYTMTSPFTTGGIRGGKEYTGKFQPRSFNMGIDRELFLKEGGFFQTNLGEDIELSTRLHKKGIFAHLLTKAFVYHKRRNTLSSFYKQARSFGQGRVITGRKNKGSIKLVHWFPSAFLMGWVLMLLMPWLLPSVSRVLPYLYFIYYILIFMGGLIKEKSIKIAFLCVITATFQLCGYGWGFLREFFSLKNMKSFE